MKNYKHSVKSGNAMKLAAVASAAIMMAPVALNSVSTFASAGEQTTTVGVTLASTATRNALSDAITNAKAQAAVPSKTTGISSVDKLLAGKNATLNGQISKAEAALAGVNFNNGTKFDYSKGLTEAAALDLIAILAEDINDAAQVTEAGTPVASAAAFAAQEDQLKAAAAEAATKAASDSKAAAKEDSLNKQAAAQQAQKEAGIAAAKAAAATAKKSLADEIDKAVDVYNQNKSNANGNLQALSQAITAAQDAYKTKTTASDFASAQDTLNKSVLLYAHNESIASTATAKAAAKSAAASLAAAKKQYAELSSAAKSTDAAKAFRAAIDDASNQVQNNTVLTAVAATKLAGSLTDAYNATVKAGANADLNAAQRALQVAMTNAQKSATALSSYKGANAATVKAFNDFDGVIKAAQAVLNNRNSTPEALSAATANVAKAAATLGNDIALATSGNDLASAKKAEANALVGKLAAEKLAAAKDKLARTKTGVAHVNYAKGYGIQVWTKDHKIVRNADGSAKKLGGETNWKVFGSVQNFGGKLYYCVGGNQYVDADYVTVTFNLAK